MLADIPFLLSKAILAKAVAPPALAPVDLRVSSVLASAKSVCSACISAPAVETLRESNGLLAIELKSETIADKSVTPS